MNAVAEHVADGVKVTIVPCLSDNYAYLLECTKTGRRTVVDPSEAGPVLDALAGKSLDSIWCTHHHHDHVGGNLDLLAACNPKEVLAHESESTRVPGFSRGVGGEETFPFGELRVRALFVPGHTRGAVAYFVEAGATKLLFSGDTLFLAGCGRLFEGTKEQMLASFDRMAQLPDVTRIFPGHEYTAKNLEFAASLGLDVASKAARVAELRAEGRPSVPGALADERAENPFFRVDDVALRSKLGFATATRAEVFGEIRRRKDVF